MSVRFAVVREDPAPELELVAEGRVRSALLVASGGCMAMAIGHAHPTVDLVLFDINPAQLAHAERRAEAVRTGDHAALNIGTDSPEGSSQCGDFESLFRILATAIRERVVAPQVLEAWFERGPHEDSADEARAWFQSAYWPAVFHCAFNDSLLVAMFGVDAVQHAAPGSYPAYFQQALERGLVRSDGPTNPFLQHILLGRYLPRDAPGFLTGRQPGDWRGFCGGLLDVPNLARFDLVHLSNIFDWSDDAAVSAWGRALQVLEPGAAITIRQLNNARDVCPPGFTVDLERSRRLTGCDRSLFYDRVLVAFRDPA